MTIPPGSEPTIAFISGITDTATVAGTSFSTWDGNSPATYGLGSSNNQSFAFVWGGTTPGAGATVSYWFGAGSAWTTAEQNAFLAGMHLWSALADITFVVSADATSADIIFQRVNDGTAGATGPARTMATIGASTTGTIANNGQVVIAIDDTGTTFGPIGDPSVASSYTEDNGHAYGTIIHELGHALGLGHAGPYNAGDGLGSVPARQLSAYDSLLWSVMSYISPTDNTALNFNQYPVAVTDWSDNPATSTTIEGEFEPTTPMMLDILAIQRLYGLPNNSPLLASGQTFGFNSSIAGDVGNFFDFTVNRVPIVTIWAGGDGHELDLSGWSDDAIINIGPGQFTSANGMTNNIAIAMDTIVDHATGGSGDDQINGTDRANTLVGNDGTDTINGFDGADTLDGGAGDDVLKGGGGGDLLEGGLNDDELWGEDGDDVLKGGGGADGLVGGLGTDTADYLQSADGVTVNLLTGLGSGGDAAGDVFSGIENVTGSNFLDLLIGDANANTLQGNDGADVLEGGGAGDNMLGGPGSDTLSYAASTAGVTVNLATHEAVGGHAAGDTFDSMENLQGSGLGDNLIGDGNNNRLQGLAGNDTLKGAGGADTLLGGLDNDLLFGESGNDVLNGGLGADQLSGADGTDTISYAGSSAGVIVNLVSGQSDGGDAEGDTWESIEDILGSSFDDWLTGDGNINELSGGDGNDILGGLGGNDRLFGGFGNDVYYVEDGGDQVFESLAEGHDTVYSWVSLYSLSFNVEDLILLEADAFHAAGGSGVGNSGNNLIVGNSIGNLLNGQEGNDTLRGGGGDDTLQGGEGFDFADYSDAPAAVTVDLGASTPQNTGGGGIDTLSSIEGIIGSVFNDILLRGFVANATLIGGDGNDTFHDHNAGNDRFEGGSGTDTVDYITSGGAGVVVNLATGTAMSVGGSVNTLVSIENASGSSGNDTLSGDGNTNELRGRGGADTLLGNGGSDFLFGDDGDDLFIGGGGADTMNGSDGTDTASYASDTAAMNINIASSFAQGGSSTGDTFGSIENVIGGSGNDTITGTSFANVLDGGNGNDTLNGGENNDTLLGGGGADALNGGNGIDTASYSDQTANLNINLLASTAAGGSATGDTFNSIENVTGGSGNDTLTGNGGNNVLTGGLGMDTLNGGNGNDTLVGGDGNDLMNGGAGADSFNGGTGGDRVTYTDQTAVLNINLTSGTGSGGDAAGDTYTLVEHVAGGSNNDIITGNTGNNILDGNNGNDIINGGNGLDTINGGEGNDRISGGAGADVMNGGNGTDTIVYNEQTGNLVINLTTQTVSGGTTAGDTITSFESILSGSGNDTLIGSSVNNVINGGGGNDSITGAGGNDTLAGSTGDDTFVYADGWGIDTISDFSTSDLEDIDLAALTNITDFTDLLANHVRETAGVLEVFDGTNVIRLTGYTLADIGVASAISANDFIF